MWYCDPLSQSEDFGLKSDRIDEVSSVAKHLTFEVEVAEMRGT